MIGKRIGGRYEIVRNIGEGGMSKVYLAHDVILDRDVAIKVLNYDFANEEALKRRFKREALSATSLTHPHIVDIFDVGEEDELHYLVMEYIEGQTLKQFIKDNGPLTPEQALPIMQQIVSALANAHHNGIIHRDVKPQNILMDSDGDVKITDFGIAMALSATAHTKTNSVIGTVHYLSPEQARGRMATKKSDIYSLGIVFYELLSGELPFSADTAVAIALKHLQEETPSVKKLFPTIPQSVENVILKATMKDAAYRYDSADEMYDDLSTVLLPERADEKKFEIVFDDDHTRAIPIVNESPKFDNIEMTKKIEPVESEQPPVPKKKRKKWPYIVGGTLVAILLILLLTLIPGILGPKMVEIPEVAGMEEKAAEDLLVEKGFKVDERTAQPSNDVDAGDVIRTMPEAGIEREVGSSVTLYISTGKEEMTLLDYRKREYSSVTELLENFDFKSVKSEEIFSDEPEGTILEQSHEPGTDVVPSETDLVFTVSKGKDMRTVGNIVGFNNDQLKEYAKTSGFNIEAGKQEYHDTVPAGQVISQNPGAGSSIEKGGKVEVVVSKGQKEKSARLYVETVTIEYRPEVIEPNPDVNEPESGEEVDSNVENDTENEIEPKPVEQMIRIYVQDKDKTMTSPIEEFPITETIQKDISLKLEEGQSGAYKVTRDKEIIIEKEVP